MAVVNLLEQYGLASDNATDGREAFEMVKERFDQTGETYKLILMDVYMPICDGFKSLELIRAFYKDLSEQGITIERLPYVCFLTAHLKIVQQDAVGVEGIDCILQKPIFKPGIQQLLTKALMF